MNKPLNNKAWFLILPVFLCVAFSAILPLMTVVNYSVQDIISPEQHVFVGVDWFRQILRDGDLQDALTRQLIFSLCVLAVEIPLGIGLALSMPSKGWKASAALVVLAMPLLIPWNVVGTIWQIFGRSDIGLAGYWLNQMGIDYNYTSHSFDAWITVLIMDVWHWTPLVALLAYAGLRSIPDAFYQAAEIDGASRLAVFRYIQLPKMRGVLMIGVLLRFMDSFMIYTEPFVLTGGGPGNATTFLSQYLTQKAVGQFDLGPAAASRSCTSSSSCCSASSSTTGCSAWAAPARPWETTMPKQNNNNEHKRKIARAITLAVYVAFAVLPLYWMLSMSLKTNEETLAGFSIWPKLVTFDNYKIIFTDPSWYWGYINSIIYVTMNTVLSTVVALPAAYAFSRYRFLGDKHMFFWLLTNRMTPPAVFLLPFFQLYSTVGLMDTHLGVALAHMLFNVPLAVWILEGFMSGIPREIDETAYIDGYSFPKFFLKIFLPLIKAGVGVTAFFCFMFSWVELLLARTLTSVDAKPITAVMTRTVSASGMDWGVLAAAGVLTIIPGALVIWFVRNYIAKGFAMGRV